MKRPAGWPNSRHGVANRSLNLTDGLYRYLLGVGVREPEVLAELREATEAEEMSMMRSAPEQGQFMALLLRLMGASQVLEIGTFTGYATLWMALALPRDGRLVTCDVSERWTFIAHRFWEQAGVQDRIHLHLRPALETLDELLEKGGAASFDFAFIDADKENYDAYFETCLELVRPGGLIAVDNTLWDGKVIDLDNNDDTTRAIRAFNRKLTDDPRFELSMLPIADGLTLVLKHPV